MDPKCSYMCSYESEPEGDLTTDRHRRRWYADGGGGWKDMTTNQGMPTATRRWKRLRTESPLESPEGACPC